MKQLSATSAAYLAGLIDGEGTIGLFINHCPTRRTAGGAAVARLKIGMCDEALIKWLKQSTESGSVTSWRQSNPKHRRVWVITWGGRKAVPILKAVWPYLRLKRPQAKVFLQWITLTEEWQGKLGGRGRRDRCYPDAVWKEAERLAAEIRKLNHVGSSV